jgi:hypothetical protein
VAPWSSREGDEYDAIFASIPDAVLLGGSSSAGGAGAAGSTHINIIDEHPQTRTSAAEDHGGAAMVGGVLGQVRRIRQATGLAPVVVRAAAAAARVGSSRGWQGEAAAAAAACPLETQPRQPLWQRRPPPARPVRASGGVGENPQQPSLAKGALWPLGANQPPRRRGGGGGTGSGGSRCDGANLQRGGGSPATKPAVSAACSFCRTS